MPILNYVVAKSNHEANYQVVRFSTFDLATVCSVCDY